MRIKHTLLTLLTLIASVSCVGNKATTKESNTKSSDKSAALYVDTLHLQRQEFNKQIVCNGKLRAITKSDIRFSANGIINSVNIKNGDWVNAGYLMAELNTEKADIGLKRAQRLFDKAQFDLTDRLIDQGYGYDTDTVNISKLALDNAKHSSGYSSAEDDLLAAQRTLAECYVYAPFSGRVANVEAKIYDNSDNDPLCTLIDDSYFDVEFNILEAELEEIYKGQKVNVMPFINESRLFNGSITQINPLIDEKGQIKVSAKVANSDNYLIEGMNVKLVFNRVIEDQYVVPKSAVVLRDGYHVIFRYIGGEAVWTYVDVIMSNIDSHLITGNKEKGTELSDTDIIITSGNRNLADGVKVNIK